MVARFANGMWPKIGILPPNRIRQVGRRGKPLAAAAVVGKRHAQPPVRGSSVSSVVPI
jgi:hypothetical protein